MGFNDRIDFDLNERMTELVDMGLIKHGTQEYDVAQQVIHQGEPSLTPQQTEIWQRSVIPLLEEALTDEQRFMQQLREDQQHEAENERHYRFTVQKYAVGTEGLSLETTGEKISARTAREAAIKMLGHDVATRGNKSDLAAKVHRIGDDFKPVIDLFYHPHDR